DHGSLSAGGRTIDELTSATYFPPSHKGSAIWRRIFSRGARANNTPSLALTDGIEPGQCWAFHGDSGQLGIRLARAIRVNALTVGHANLPTALSAPKNVALWGLKPADGDFCTSSGDVSTSRPNFGSGYCCHDHSTPYQNFTAFTDYADYFDHVIVEVSRNWGHPSFTCIYRVQIYGTTTTTTE
ncbi:UNC-like C-terminal-domain-containing protein, partial [Lactarius hatsudake]